jgi:eukaryotic-like serine/threonine-protein kinase
MDKQLANSCKVVAAGGTTYDSWPSSNNGRLAGQHMGKQESIDAFEPTIIHELSVDAPQTNDTSAEVSRAQVGFVEGNKPRFSDETALLLRNRLKAVAFVFLIVLTAAFFGNMLAGNVPLAVVRGAVLLVFAGSFFALRSGLVLSLTQLRLIELTIFSAIAAQVLLMMSAQIMIFAGEGDATSAVAAKHRFLAASSIVILTYGIFMPNEWKRAAAVLIPAACLPYIVLFVLRWQVDNAATALAADKMGSPIPLPFVATLVAVYGTHFINSVRREAFKARQFGQYRLKERLGAGGMGEVYRAEHTLLKRPCAIKLIKQGKNTDAAALAGFEREVQSTARLTHWNSVDIFDFGHTDDGTFYYVMELLPGKSLDELVKDHGPLPAERVIHFLRQMCGALREAHGLGLIHRDLKPANIFAAKRGGLCDVTKLLDFGLVKQAATDQTEEHAAHSGSFSGSPSYMPPEQATSYGSVDGRGDIYSLGAVAYYLLTGKPPFAGKNPVEIIIAHAQNEVVPPSSIEPSVPADLERIVIRCLEKEPENRFQDVASLEEALSECESADRWTAEKAIEWWNGVELDDG